MKRRIAALFSALLIVLTLPLTALTLTGDVDQSGHCTTQDVRLVLRYIVGEGALTEEQPKLADINGDGAVNTEDVRAMLTIILEDDPLSAAAYCSEPYIVLENNIPLFTDADKQATAVFEIYAPLDGLGRCGVAYANLGTELMPEDDRESISSVTPSGWHNTSYDFVSGGWVYNRCHLIGFQLAGENANECNLITGTRFMNTEGMLPFENMVADYIKETDNHVLYRVVPIFKGDNLLCEGVTMEAWSVEDNGDGICFYVFCYNVQDGVVFDYATGENHAADELPDEEITTITFILNTSTKKFHLLTCRYVSTIAEENYAESGDTREMLIADGYAPCGTCKP